MAHKTLIDGTAYKISGGKTLVNGTAYSIKNGKTLVGGTAYEVVFAPAMATITLTCYGYDYAYVVIDGTTYSYGDAVIEVPIGTVIECYISSDDWNQARPSISINGEWMTDDPNSAYEYTVVGNVSIYAYEDRDGNRNSFGVIEITEQ